MMTFPMVGKKSLIPLLLTTLPPAHQAKYLHMWTLPMGEAAFTEQFRSPAP